jgi:hypothetical protein
MCERALGMDFEKARGKRTLSINTPITSLGIRPSMFQSGLELVPDIEKHTHCQLRQREDFIIQRLLTHLEGIERLWGNGEA